MASSTGTWTASTLAAALIVAVMASAAPAANAPPSIRKQLNGDVTWKPRSRPAPDSRLRDGQRRMFSMRAARGRVVMLTFLYSRCRQICPIEGHQLTGVFDALHGRADPLLLVVSVDPSRDTAGSIRRFVARAGWTGSWRWLRGTRPQLAPVWRAYGIEVVAGRTDIGHSSALYLIDRQGYERSGYAVPFLPVRVARDVLTLADE